MKLYFFTYKLPFKKAFNTAKHNFSNREGIVFELQKDGIRSMGEAAPLPGFSKETLKDIKRELTESKADICRFFDSSFTLDSTRLFLESEQFYPSLAFGIYTLVIFYLAQIECCSAHKLLFNNFQSRPAVNAVLGLETDHYEQEIQNHKKKGYSTFKIKINKDWPRFFSIIKQIRQQHPDIGLRLDANQSWSPEEAVQNLKQTEKLNIEYCEEPLARPDAKSLAKLQESSAVPIALDESLSHNFKLTQAVKLAPVLLIKPMVLGQPFRLHAFLKQAKKNTTKFVLTTSLESGIGRLMTATLAAGLGSPELAHGLGTGAMLKNDIWKDDIFLQNGHFNLPDANRLSTLMHTSFDHLNITKL